MSAIPPRRIEIKFLVTRAHADAVIAAASAMCARDEHSAADGSYRIFGLYFDTWDRELARSSRSRVHRRLKVRARTYQGSEVIFLEAKCRVGTVVEKHRIRLHADEWPGVLSQPAGNDPRWVRDGFLDLVTRRGLRPSAGVSYRREAWVGIRDPYLRITIDSELRCWRPRALSEALNPAEGTLLPMTDFAADAPPQAVVLEIKSLLSPPRWLTGLVRGFTLQPVGVSKFLLADATLARANAPGEPVALRRSLQRAVGTLWQPAAAPIPTIPGAT